MNRSDIAPAYTMSSTIDPFAADQQPKPKPKKPLFKRQAKAAPKTQSAPAVPDANSPVVEKDDEDLALFKQSKHFFPVILRNQDEEREAELRKSQDRSASEARERNRQIRDKTEGSDDDIYDASPRASNRKRRTSSHDRPITPPSSKRNRTNPESRTRDSSRRLDKGKGLAAPYSLATPTKGSFYSSHAAGLDDSEDDATDRKRLLPTPRGGVGSRGGLGNGATPTISLDDSDDDNKAAVIKKPSESDDEIEEIPPATEPEDDQFAHFVAQAEARRAAQRKAAAAKEATAAAGGPVPVEDRVVTIIVTSRLGGPDMKPIQFRRRVSGNIKAVRDCVGAFAPSRGRPLTPAEQESLFVTWKGRKLFNQNTVMSLGVIPDEDGVLRRTATPDGPGMGRQDESDGYTEGGALHFEAWTEEGYEAWSRQQKKRHRRELGEPVSDDEEGADAEAARNGAAGPEQSAKSGGGGGGGSSSRIRIIMKSKDHEPVKTSVAPTDTVADLILAFRTCRHVGADKQVEIRWDGDKLDGETTIEEAEIEDKDTVEVYVR
ncbi:hypothetical protein RB601_006492 [Gaeumannomyces tritici]